MLLNSFHKLNMPAKVVMEYVKKNADLTERTIVELKSEFESLINQYNNVRAQELREENAKLTLFVEDAKKRLVQNEVKNGTTQIPICNASAFSEPTSTLDSKSVTPAIAVAKPKKEKKSKEAAKKPLPELESPIDIGRLDLRIGKVENVEKHPDADSLYVLKIKCGDEKPRTVCSGLVKYMSEAVLKDRDVVLLCNLKPAKMRGITSEAMVMCASSSEAVEVLSPPSGCHPGEYVQCDGYVRNPDPVMNPKKKIFETVAPDLATNDLFQACYKGVPLNIPGKGFILSATLKCCPVK